MPLISISYIPKHKMSLSCTKYSNTLDILLLRTNMSEWNVWVTMPQVAAATSLPNTLQQQTALSRSALRLYLSRLLHCISRSAARLYLSRSSIVFLSVSRLFPLPQAASFHSVQWYRRQFAPCGLSLITCPRWNVIPQHWKIFFIFMYNPRQVVTSLEVLVIIGYS